MKLVPLPVSSAAKNFATVEPAWISIMICTRESSQKIQRPIKRLQPKRPPKLKAAAKKVKRNRNHWTWTKVGKRKEIAAKVLTRNIEAKNNNFFK